MAIDPRALEAALRAYTEAHEDLYDFDASALDAVHKNAMENAIAAYEAARPAGTPEGWRPIETAPKDTALLLVANFGLEIGHYNTALNRWVDGEHRPLKQVVAWQPSPALPSRKWFMAVEFDDTNGEAVETTAAPPPERE